MAATVRVRARRREFLECVVTRPLRNLTGRLRVDNRCAISLEELTPGATVIVKCGQTAPVLANYLQSWCKAIWPLDNTPIPIEIAQQLMPNLQADVYFPSAYDEAVWYHTGASVVVVPRCNSFIERFGSVITMQQLYDQREAIGRYFAMFPKESVGFVPWQLALNSSVSPYGYDFHLCGPAYSSTSTKIRLEFSEPEPVQTLIMPLPQWEALDPDVTIRVMMDTFEHGRAMAYDWSRSYGALTTTKREMNVKQDVIKTLFGKWPNAILNLRIPGQPPILLLGPFSSHIIEPF